jgi:hypothetical protein
VIGFAAACHPCRHPAYGQNQDSQEHEHRLQVFHRIFLQWYFPIGLLPASWISGRAAMDKIYSQA